MAGSILAAFIAAFAAIAGIFLTQFLAERYRRFMDGTALAAGVYGEIAAYKKPLEIWHLALRTWKGSSSRGYRDRIPVRPMPKQDHRFFGRVVEKVGSLGPRLVEDIIYLYSKVDAFRLEMETLGLHHQNMNDDEFVARIDTALEALEHALEREPQATEALRARINEKFSWFSLR